MADLAAARLALAGCGKMGGALLRGWLAGGLSPRHAVVVEPMPVGIEDLAAQGVRIVASPDAIPAAFTPDAVILAVKPQVMDAVVSGCARLARPGTFFLSIAAGKTIAYFRRHLGEAAAIVRAMPNTPAAIGRGISVAVAGAKATAKQRALADRLLSACGEVAWVTDEALMDPVTALSGGGPAYIFLLIEALAEAGRKAGLPAELAMRLARATVSGAGELARLSPEPAAELRRNVTSPGGTTQEALAILMAPDGLQPLLDRAIAAATRRSRELAD
ncbi:MAG TPA: pyrroline-5-carboxylate reductase [Dongiaceae bacterium]|nr:pyrroline-5-carboxylate reductase [Dongiaceae bacterium]